MFNTINSPTKIYFLVGEESGDFIGSKIILEIKRTLSNTKFLGIGGQYMLNAGLENTLFPISSINLIGFFEIIPFIFKIKKLINKTIENIIIENPSIIITIDAQEFSYHIVNKIKKLKLKTKFLHIVAPSVWFYRSNRAVKYAKIFDYLICLLPFEPKLFQKHGLPSSYVGHFLFEDMKIPKLGIFKKKYNIKSEDKIICLTPGSRESEIKLLLPIFLSAILLLKNKFKKLIPIIAISNIKYLNLIQNICENFNLKILNIFKEDHLSLYKDSQLVIAKSGTNNLEILACGAPVIINYKLNIFSYLYIKNAASSKHISLINILANKEIIKELIQKDCTPEKIAHYANQLLTNPHIAQSQVHNAQKILNLIGFQNNKITPIKSTVKKIIELINL